MRLLHAVAFSKKLPWFEPTKVISLKTQPHAVNARRNAALRAKEFDHFNI